MLSSCARRPDPLPEFPKVMLWAWERPGSLEFIDPVRAGVAYLARTLTLRQGHVTSQGRRQPLRVPPGTALMAVVRVESDGLSLADTRTVADEIVYLLQARALQIDFDARLSEREWYRALIGEVRKRLTPGVAFEITALTSWCESDGWLAGLPVAEAVPMLFRMGPGERWRGGDFDVLLCRSSVGVSTDELPANVPHGRRLFFFNPRPWTVDSYNGVLREAKRWR